MPRHILIKLIKTKHKERILKAEREKQQVTYKGNSIHLTADLSAETLQARRERQDIVKAMKGKTLQPSLLHPARISFQIDGEIKSFQTSKSEENAVLPNQVYNKCKRDSYSQEINEEKKKCMRKFLKRLWLKISPTWKRK